MRSEQRISFKAAWAAILVASAATAFAQQRYEIKPRFEPGQRWSEQRINAFELTTSLTAQQQVVEQTRQKSRETYKMEWEVLAVANGTPSAARVSFDASCGVDVEENGQKQTVPFAAAGKTVEARRRGDGEVDFKPAEANTPEVQAIFENLFEPDPGMFPKQPLAVGESWSWDKSSVAESFGLTPDDKGSVTCTLKNVSMRSGREVGEVLIRVSLKKGEAQEGPGQRIATLTESTLEGPGLMDIAAGRLVEVNLSGDVTMSGLFYGPDEYGNLKPQADIDGKGRMTMEMRASLVGGQPPGGGSQVINAGAAAFAGEYFNDEMTLTLKRGGAGYEGVLRSGDSEFPVRGKDEAGAIKGSFQSDGHWFDFTATLSGTTLSLTTGGKAHILQKKVTPTNPLGGAAAENPLGKEKPANPLDGVGTTETSAPTPNSAPKPIGGGDAPVASRFSVFRCLDEHGFRDPVGRPLEVFRMLIPEGWRFFGGVTWKIHQRDVRTLDRADLVNPATLTFKVASPGERVALETYPEVRFADLRGSPAYEMGTFPIGSNYGGFTVCPVMDPAAYITEFVIPQQRGLQNVQIVESKDLASVAARYERETAIITSALQSVGAGGVSHRAAQVTVDYDLNGQTYREVFVVALAYLQTPGITMWSSHLNISARAPRDEAERWKPTVATMVNSIEFNMRWVGEYLKLQKQAEGVIIDVDRFCRKVDAEITANRAETNSQIQRDMYPRLAPFCDHTGPDGKRYFLETDQQHQMNERGEIRSGLSLPDQDGWTRMPEYTGP